MVPPSRPGLWSLSRDGGSNRWLARACNPNQSRTELSFTSSGFISNLQLGSFLKDRRNQYRQKSILSKAEAAFTSIHLHQSRLSSCHVAPVMQRQKAEDQLAKAQGGFSNRSQFFFFKCCPTNRAHTRGSLHAGTWHSDIGFQWPPLCYTTVVPCCALKAAPVGSPKALGDVLGQKI